MSPYAELHAHSNFSFLDGGSHFEELVLRARQLGYEALVSQTTTACTGATEVAIVWKIGKSPGFTAPSP